MLNVKQCACCYHGALVQCYFKVDSKSTEYSHQYVLHTYICPSTCSRKVDLIRMKFGTYVKVDECYMMVPHAMLSA